MGRIRKREGGGIHHPPVSRSMGCAEEAALAVVRMNAGRFTVLPPLPTTLLPLGIWQCSTISVIWQYDG